ncbi:hypothetical protein BASA81_001413 [Batrachochytrium salamandrivorans]|nr:hypothetical protein BASA81_001413 [Batrachochytrium salamandrivorans]
MGNTMRSRPGSMDGGEATDTHVPRSLTSHRSFKSTKSSTQPVRRTKSTGESLVLSKESREARESNLSLASQMTFSLPPLQHHAVAALAHARQRDGGSFTTESEDMVRSGYEPVTVGTTDQPTTTTTTTTTTGIGFGYIELPRGGFVVATKALGAVQFGIPPETIKDSLVLGMSVPKHFVVQGDMFDRKLGLSRAEFEFPIYYQFFLCRSKVNIITFADHERRIRIALQQTLFGPSKDELALEEDYPLGTPSSAFPNFAEESNGLDPSPKSLDDLVTFTLFNEDTNIAHVMGEDGKMVSICLFTQDDVISSTTTKHKTRLLFKVKEGEDTIALVPGNVKLRSAGNVSMMFDTSSHVKSKRFAKAQAKREYEREERKQGQVRNGPVITDSMDTIFTKDTFDTLPRPRRTSTSMLLPESTISTSSLIPLPSTPSSNFAPFDIPIFGVTMMGTSHGFDPNGRTTGFVLWMNRRGLMVDPPPDSSKFLELMGIPPLAIEAVILTHIHADHDAGTFQQILRTRQIQLYTTRTIERSFIKKYSSITGFDQSFLRSLFGFHPVQCGQSVGIKMYGGELMFHYSLHTIPCMGFEAHYESHSMAYSADTRYDPQLVQFMLDHGKMGQLRAEQLMAFPYDHSLILYEMGVPPIHTPVDMLRQAALDPKHYRKHKPLKDRLFVVHASHEQKKLDFAHASKDWLTIRIAAHPSKDKKLSEIVSVLSNVEWLKSLDYDLKHKLAKQCNKQTWEQGELITVIEPDGFSESIWIVLGGQVSGTMDKEEEILMVGESFGLSSLLDVLEMDGRRGGTLSRLRRVPGVPLGVEILNASANAIRYGFSSPHRHHHHQQPLPHDHNQVFRAKSRCFVIEIPNQILVRMLSKSKPLKMEITERLRRFIGWPNDGRWCALQRNDILVRLLTNQFAVREYLQNLSEEYVFYPAGYELQGDGQVPKSALFIKQGTFRVTPIKSRLKWFKPTIPNLPGVLNDEPFECSRGSLVGDFNALIKQEGSAYRIVCLEDCEVYHFASRELLAFFEAFPGIKFHFIDRIMLGWMLNVVNSGSLEEGENGEL